MTDWNVHLIQIGKFGNHPNGDNLSITQVYGQNVIFQRGTYKEGDLAIFLPPDTCMPMDPEHVLLKDNPGLKPGHRVDAKRIRGIFSNGFTVPAHICFTEEELKDIPVGTHVADRIGVTKFKNQGERLANSGESERDLGYMPKYTDIDGWAKFRNHGVIQDGEEVVLTEKIHGMNARFCFRDKRLWVGSHGQIKAQYIREDGTEGNLFWKVAKDLDLENKFRTNLAEGAQELGVSDWINIWGPVLYGEVYGKAQDLNYGIASGNSLRIFDTWNPVLCQYNDWDDTVEIAASMGLETVPVLYRGPWKPELEELRNGPSVLYPGHIREGYVIKPVKERQTIYVPGQRHGFTGRVCFKNVGESFKLRKQK